MTDLSRDAGRPAVAVPSVARRVGLAATRLLGLDYHIIGTLLLRCWSIIAGSLMIVLIPIWLSRVEQGYYYTFASLLALQIFFELGMNQIVVQLVGHEVAHVPRTGDQALLRDPVALAKLIALTRLLGRWYRVASILFAIVAGAGGAIFFASQPELPSRGVLVVWGVLTLATAANLYLSPWLAVLEGMGEVGRVARLRLIQSIIGYVLTIVALAAGAGLNAVPLLTIAAVGCTTWWLARREPMLGWLRHDATPPAESGLNWRRDIFPFQWRIAVSWISGYFSMQLFVPMIFTHRGAVEAGRLGMSMSIFNAVLTIGLSWVNAKLPVMTGQIARGEHRALNALFFAALARSLTAVVLGGVAVVIASYLLPVGLRGRLAEPTVMMLLAAAMMLVCLISGLASYMRAHKEEPLLVSSVTIAALILPAVFFGSQAGTMTMMALYVGILAAVALPWTLVLFGGYVRRHRI